MVKHYWIGDVGECKFNPLAYLIINAQVSNYGLARFMTPVAISNVLIATTDSTSHQAVELNNPRSPISN
jgi:hypothetical protein